MKKLSCIFVCLALMTTPGLALQSRLHGGLESALPLNLLEAGDFHGDEVSARTGETWLGLARVPGGFSLRPVVLRVTTVNDPIVDENPNTKTGRRVAVTGAATTIFLLKGFARPRTGLIQTVASERLMLKNTTDLQYDLAGRQYRLRVVTRDLSANDGITMDDAKLVLTCDDETQVLYALGGDGSPTEVSWSLRWAGDLDGDGRLDLYLDASDHSNVTERRLFLSSAAGKGKLVKEVARFRTVGC